MSFGDYGENEIIYFIKKLIKSIDIPLSVSLFNIRYKIISKESPITEGFMKRNRHVFKYFVVGDDLKIQLQDNLSDSSDATDPTLTNEKVEKLHEDYFKLYNAISKDHAFANELKNKLSEEKTVTFDKMLSFRSNKRSINLPFIIHNSHIFKILSRDQQTYITTLSNWEDNITMDENDLWEVINKDHIQGLLFILLTNVLIDFFEPVHQGTLQSCFHFGTTINKDFTRRYRTELEINESGGISLASESKSSVTSRKDAKRIRLNSPSKKPESFITTTTQQSSKNHNDQIDSMLSKDELDEDGERSRLADDNQGERSLLADDNHAYTFASDSTTNFENELNENTSRLNETVATAISEGKSVVVIGNRNSETVILNLNNSSIVDSEYQRWEVVENLMKSIRENR